MLSPRNWLSRRLCVLGTVLMLATTMQAQSLTNLTFVAFDLETTGVSRRNDRVIEIGAVKFRNGRVLARKQWLINPGRTISPASQRVHGISDAMVTNAPPFGAVYPLFLDFIGDHVLMAHNARFDTSFVAAEAQRLGVAAPSNAVLDTLDIARVRYPDAEAYNLEYLCEWLKLPLGRHHRGLADSDHLMNLFQNIIRGHYDRLEPLLEIGQTPFKAPPPPTVAK